MGFLVGSILGGIIGRLSNRHPDLSGRDMILWYPVDRDRNPTGATIGTAMQAFLDNGVDIDSLKLFKMRQDDTCVNDKDGSCSENPANLMIKQ